MRRLLSRVVVPLFVVAAMALAVSPGSAQTFWYGLDLADSQMTYDKMEVIHDAIKDGMTDLVNSPTGFPSGDLMDPEDRGVRIYDRKKAWNGYTLLNSFAGTGSDKNGNNILIDMNGNIVNEWAFPGAGYMSAAKFLPGGHVVGASLDPDAPPMTMHGKLTQLNWQGEVVKQWETTSHHDHERQGSPCGYYAPHQWPRTYGGKVLALEMTEPDEALTGHICASKRITDDLIRELSWDGEELFRWDFWKHFEELGLDAWAEAGIDQGLNYMGPDFMADLLPEDWSHGNAVAWVGPNKWWWKYRDYRFHPDNIIADFRSLNVTLIIARHDFPKINKKQGEIVWQLGPDYSAAGDDYRVGQIIGQHMAHMIPLGLPGAGNMLILDNGGAAGYGALVQGLRNQAGEPLGTWPNTFRTYSRVVEIDPRTKQVVWEYKQPYPSEDMDGDGKIRGNEKLFFSNLMSGAQRLANGNTLITEADTGRVFEVTRKGEVVWEFGNKWGSPTAFMGEAIYRAYRVPYSWVPRGRHGRR